MTESACTSHKARGIGGIVVAILLSLISPTAGMATDWMMFAFDADQHANNIQESAINASNVTALVQVYKKYPALTTSGPVFLSNVATTAGSVDMLFVTAKDGTLLAIDASNGDTVWSQSTSHLSNRVDAAPVVDPNRQHVYGHGADGKIHKYAVTDGTEFIRRKGARFIYHVRSFH
jgi:outer membrane protein assembly factor BamB